MGGRFSSSDIRFSLEVFPPRTDVGRERLLKTVDAYTALKPSYLSVTFGAGGSEETVDYTRDTATSIVLRTHIPVAAHVTCAHRRRAETDAIIDGFWRDGVRHIVALRGDMRGQGVAYQPHPEGYFYTHEFVESIKKRHPEMTVAVAGYPELHPESPNLDFDIEHLKRKVDAGADAVLTQFFFDPEVFLRWRDIVTAHGINISLYPGILPIHSFPKAVMLAQRCNASIPKFLHTMFEGIDPESIDHKLLAMNVLSHQVTRLIEHDVKAFHFYTMNEELLTRHLCTWLRSGF